MALPSSGVLKLSDLVAEFGGGNRLSDFYRGGGLVPSSISKREPASGTSYNISSTHWYRRHINGSFQVISIKWGGSNILSNSTSDVSSYSSGGWTYHRGSLADTVNTPPPEPGFPSVTERYYGIYRTGTDSLNTGIPSSGQLKLSDFYGGRAA